MFRAQLRRGLHIGRLAGYLLFGMLVGCVDFNPPLVPPTRGGPAWTELTSRHFVLLTNVEVREATRALSEFETYHRALASLAFPRALSSGGAPPIQIILFERAIDFRQFAGRGVHGIAVRALPNDPEPVPTLAFYGSNTESTRIVFLHELTHELVARSFRAPPAWLNEGLALYYSTLLLEGGSAHLGLQPPSLPFSKGSTTFTRGRAAVAVPIAHIPPVATLVRLGPKEFYELGRGWDDDQKREVMTHFAGAWALVHMLHHGDAHYRARYAAFLEGARREESAAEAWARAFDGVPADDFQSDFLAHLSLSRASTDARPYQVPANVDAPRVRPMSNSEVHLLWARLRVFRPSGNEGARQDLDEAVALAPASPEPRFWRALYRAKSLRLREAEDDFVAALALEPDEPRYLLGFGMALFAEIKRGALRDDDPRLAGVMARLRRVATSAHQLDFVARYARFTGNDAESLSFAERAIARDPSCARCFDTYASSLYRMQRWGDAIDAKRRALGLANYGDDTRRSEEQLLCFLNTARRTLSPRVVIPSCVDRF